MWHDHKASLFGGQEFCLLHIGDMTVFEFVEEIYLLAFVKAKGSLWGIDFENWVVVMSLRLGIECK